MIKIGQKVKFDPIREHKSWGSKGVEPKKVTATVVYVNEENQWFTAEYTGCFGEKIRTAFKFWDIGKTVTVCGD